MKKDILIFSIAALTAMTFGSCSKDFGSTANSGHEAEVNENAEYVRVSLSANAAQYDDALAELKVSSVSDEIQWNSQDSIIIFSEKDGEYLKSRFTKTTPSGTAKSATFEGEILSGSTPAVASYPSGVRAEKVEEDYRVIMSMAIDGESFLANSVITRNPEIGLVSGESVSLKNVCGYVKFTCPDNETAGQTDIKRVVVRANTAGEYLSALGMVVSYNGGDPKILSYETGCDSVAIHNIKKSGYYLLPVIPGTYKGVTVTAYDAEDKVVYTKAGASDLVIVRSQITNLGRLTDQPEPPKPDEKITVNITPLNSTTVSGTVNLPTSETIREINGLSPDTWTLKAQSNYEFTVGYYQDTPVKYYFDTDGKIVITGKSCIKLPKIADYHITKIAYDYGFDEKTSHRLNVTKSNAAPTSGTRMADLITVAKSGSVEFTPTKDTKGQTIYLFFIGPSSGTMGQYSINNLVVTYEYDLK